MSAIPTKRDNPDGLHQRYGPLTYADGTPTDPLATYFALRLDSHGRDALHIAACRAAAREYCRYVLAEADPGHRLIPVAVQLRTVTENLERENG